MTPLRVPIDDLTWADLVRVALEDITGASQGQWTLHGPVDPGVTLLELFAYQLEQLLFIGQGLPEPVLRASLQLLGADEPATARAARTVLAFQAAPASWLDAGTVVGLIDDPLGRRFALNEGVWVLPLGGVTAEGWMAQSGDVLEFVLGDRAPVPPGAELSLLIEVAAAPGIPPSWSEEAAEVRPPAVLRWRAVGADGSVQEVDPHDDTGAFRRSGLVRLPWPPVWDAPGAGRRLLRIEAVSASYTEAVRVQGVHPNAAIAEHRVEEAVVPGLAHLMPLPGQRLTVPGAAGHLLDATLSLRELDDRRYRWTQVPSWVGVGPGDRVFVVDREAGQLVFGDGRAGRIPRPHHEQLEPDLIIGLGGGETGNLGSGLAWGSSAYSATNPMSAEGGANPESLARARQRASDALSRPDRMVTVEDFRDLAETTPGAGIRRAYLEVGRHPGFPCDHVPSALSVTVVPYANRETESSAWTHAPQPDEGVLETVRGRLRAGRLIGQEIFVVRPIYHAVHVHLSVSGSQLTDPLRRAVVDKLTRHLDALDGGSEGKGWPFGGPVRPSELMGITQDLLGPEISVTDVAVSLDGGPSSNCGDVVVPEGHLVWLSGVSFTASATLPTGGGLR